MTAQPVTTLRDLRQQHHPDCVVCSSTHAHGLRLRLVLEGDGAAAGTFDCASRYEGYPGLLHGGIISAVLDGAMTQCLFLHGSAAVTAKLTVRFRHPVLINKTAQVRAWITETAPPVFRMQAQLVQGGVIKATARASFMLPQPRP